MHLIAAVQQCFQRKKKKFWVLFVLFLKFLLYKLYKFEFAFFPFVVFQNSSLEGQKDISTIWHAYCLQLFVGNILQSRTTMVIGQVWLLQRSLFYCSCQYWLLQSSKTFFQHCQKWCFFWKQKSVSGFLGKHDILISRPQVFH